MIHISQDPERERVHLPLIFNYNGVFCSDRELLLHRLSASGVDPLATFSLRKLSQKESRGKGRKVLLRHCYTATKKRGTLLHKLSISSEVPHCY